MKKIVFVGLGAMGEPMAANLLKAGLPLCVVRHRRAEPAERLAAAGATVATSLADAAAGCGTVILCLPTSKQVEATLLVPGGLAELLAPGTLVIDCTTSHPASTAHVQRSLRARGLGFVAAGLTRGVAGAKAGTLAYFIGGPSDEVGRAKTILEKAGDTFIEFATAEQAHSAKLISNVLSYASVALVNEALKLGSRSGVDLRKLHAALSEGAPSKALEAFGSRMVANSFDPARVTITHACDDFAMAREEAASTGTACSLLSAAAELFRSAQEDGVGERDVSALAAAWRSSAVEMAVSKAS